jgi:hypothetical protein
MFAHPLKFRAAIQLTSVAVTHSAARLWGPLTVSTITPTNGAYFSVDAAGVLSLNYVSNGVVATPITSGNFNGDVSQFILDTNVHAYEIIYYTMGIWFIIDGILIHQITPAAAVLYRTLDTPITIISANDGTGGTSGTIVCWNAVILRLGRDLTAPTTGRITGNAATYTFKTGSGILQRMVFNNTSGTNITIYDGTGGAGTVLGIITTATASLGVWDMQYPFYTGLSMVTTGNSLDATIVYE